ncbi:YesL family protein [Evansella vedderi]|nr:YesL family protein [Evansella vedderi]
MPNGMMGSLYRGSEWIMRIAYVNFLWLAFTLFGLIVLGVIPATVATLAVIRKWFMGETDIPILKTFLTVYKDGFIKVNILGLLLGIAIFIVYVDFLFLNTLDGMFRIVMNIALITIVFLLFIIIVYIFPVYVHYRLKLLDYIKHALIIGILNPLPTLLMIIGLLVLYQVFVYVPGLILFFGVSLICITLMGPAYISFRKVEIKKWGVEVNKAEESH